MFRYLLSISFFLSLAVSSSAAPLVLDGAPITDLAAWASDVTGKSIVVPSDFKAMVWLRVPDASPQVALQVLRSAAVSNGWEMYEQQGMVSFRPALPVRTAEENRPEGSRDFKDYETRVYSFFKRQALDVLPVLSSLVTIGKVTLGPSNTVIVYAQPSILKRLDSLVPGLDVPRSRFQVSAIIAEDYLTDSDKQGANLALLGSDAKVAVSLAPSLTSGFLAQLISTGDFQGLYNYLSTSTKYHILSTPYVIVDDGLSGVLHVGDNVPILTGESVTSGQVVTTYQRQDVGLILNITLRQFGDRVAVDLVQEASSVSPSSTATQLITSQRKIVTKSSLAFDEIIDLGGLTTEENTDTVHSVPVLSKIPLLGYFFRSTIKERVTKNLHIFLRVSRF